MQPVGRLQANISSSSAGSGVPLRAGAFVSLKVLAPLRAGLYLVSVEGRELWAQSSVELKPGSLLRAQVESGPEGGRGSIRLRILEGREERSLLALARLGLEPDHTARQALGAALLAGIKPEAASLLRIKRAIGSARLENGPLAAELAAALESRGLELDGELFTGLLRLLGGGDGSGDGGFLEEGGGERGEPDRDSDVGQDDATSIDTYEAAADEPEASQPEPGAAATEALAWELARLCERRREPRSKAELALGLLNHARALGHNVVYIPFDLELDKVAFSGFLRLELPRVPGGPSGLSARFRVRSENREGSDWALSLRRSGAARIVELSPGVDLSKHEEKRLEKLIPAPWTVRIVRVAEQDGRVADKGALDIDV